MVPCQSDAAFLSILPAIFAWPRLLPPSSSMCRFCGKKHIQYPSLSVSLSHSHANAILRGSLAHVSEASMSRPSSQRANCGSLKAPTALYFSHVVAALHPRKPCVSYTLNSMPMMPGLQVHFLQGAATLPYTVRVSTRKLAHEDCGWFSG